MISTLQQRLAEPAAIVRELDHSPRLRNASHVRTMVAEFEGGATTVSEVDFVRLCRTHGLPKPVGQRVRYDSNGGRRRTDFEFTTRSGRILIVEVDGADHLALDRWLDDLPRQNDLTVNTRGLVLRVANWTLRYEPEPFMAQLALAINTR